MSCRTGKPTVCIGENKGADQLHSNCEADQCLFFATRIVQFLYFLNPKFPASNKLLRLYSPVCVGPAKNCLFSHAKVHMLLQDFLERTSNVVVVAMDNHAGIAYDTKVCIPELNHKYNRVIDFRVSKCCNKAYFLGPRSIWQLGSKCFLHIE